MAARCAADFLGSPSKVLLKSKAKNDSAVRFPQQDQAWHVYQRGCLQSVKTTTDELALQPVTDIPLCTHWLAIVPSPGGVSCFKNLASVRNVKNVPLDGTVWEKLDNCKG